MRKRRCILEVRKEDSRCSIASDLEAERAGFADRWERNELRSVDVYADAMKRDDMRA